MRTGAGGVGFGVTGAGTFLASYAALIDEADPARGTFPTREPRVARSDDGGRTWTDSELAPRPTRYCGQGDGSRIVQLACGTVICFCSNAWNDAAHQAGYEGDVLLRSHDDGRSWGDWTVLPPGSCESNLLEMPSGELLCATRFQREYLHPDLFDAPAGQGGGPRDLAGAVAQPGRTGPLQERGDHVLRKRRLRLDHPVPGHPPAHGLRGCRGPAGRPASC